MLLRTPQPIALLQEVNVLILIHFSPFSIGLCVCVCYFVFFSFGLYFMYPSLDCIIRECGSDSLFRDGQGNLDFAVLRY